MEHVDQFAPQMLAGRRGFLDHLPNRAGEIEPRRERKRDEIDGMGKHSRDVLEARVDFARNLKVGNGGAEGGGHDDEHRRLVESYADPGGNRGGRDAREKAEGDVLVGVKAEKVASEGDLPVELRADRSPNEGRDARSDPTNEGLERLRLTLP